MNRAFALAVLLLASSLGWGAPFGKEPPPLVAGSEGVPVPKKVRNIQPMYPPQAIAQGIRGIVILELVINRTGRVERVDVIRSVPGLDDAAVAAAHQWRYQPVKMNGRPVRVRMTVPITFSLALPDLAREAGVPELRQGVPPRFPKSQKGGGTATVAVMLAPDGRIVAKGALEGSQEPWTSALLAALDTWRFAPGSDDSIVSFRIEAEFVPAKGSRSDTVRLEATQLRVADASAAREARTATAPGSTAPAAAPGAPAAGGGASKAPTEATPEAPTTGAPGPATPAPAPEEPRPAPPSEAASATPAPAAVPAPAAPQTASAGGPPPASAEAEPQSEVVSSPVPQLPPENGISLVRDVTLEPGVPELARGRRPVPPPFARLARVTGAVEVEFSVGAGGTTTVQTVSGPDLLKPAAQGAVASWVFRRTRADRTYLVAAFRYTEDQASASVRPQSAGPAPAVPTPGTTSASPAPPVMEEAARALVPAP